MLDGHRQRVSTLSFTADGGALYSGSWDATVRRWSMAPLTAPADALHAEATARWGLDMPTALASVQATGR